MIKIIPHPDLKSATRLTPMQMNNLHFRPFGKHSAIPADCPRTSAPKQG